MMSLPEAAKSLGLAPATLRTQIYKGRIKAKRVARDWFITPEEVERYRKESKR